MRLFNPLSRQGFGTLNYIGDFKRANRRMHNKSFTVDGRITVIGGRNIAGEYFGMNPAVDFRDFELVAFGGLIPEVGDSFDDFWNHDLSVPMEAFAKNVDHNDLALMRSLQDDWREANPDAMADPTTGDGIIARLMAGEAVPYYAEAHVISDHPDKLVNPVTPEFQKLANSLGSLIEGAQEKVVVYSPYFIPQRETTDMLLELRRQGREIYILTNSLASTNHVAVHAGYRRYRQELLDGGVIIFEVSAYGGGDGEVKSTLHTKAVIVDSRWLFVGSLNVDPRSIDINTEMGLVLDAPEFVADLWAVIEKSVGQFAYEVEKGPDGKLQWRRTLPGKKEEIVTREPESTGWQRFKVGFYGMLPIESQL